MVINSIMKTSCFSQILRQDLSTILAYIWMCKYGQGLLTVVNILISKRAMKDFLCFQHTLIKQDILSLLPPATTSHLCILISINYILNETIKNCGAIDVGAFSHH